MKRHRHPEWIEFFNPIERRAYGFHDLRYFMLKILETTGALPPLEALGHPQT